MKALSYEEGPAGLDAGSLGATNAGPGAGTTVVLETRRIPVQSLGRLPSLWPRGELNDTSVKMIREDLIAVGRMVVPVVVRCDPGDEGPGPVVEMVAGEHRVRAASLEGITELPVLVLVADRPTAKLWLLREGSAPGTPRGNLETAWQVDNWIRESGFSGTQRELALRLGVAESRVSELRKFAKALPESEVLGRARRAGVPATQVASVPRAVLRRITGAGQAEALAALDRALVHLRDGDESCDAWSAGPLECPRFLYQGL